MLSGLKVVGYIVVRPLGRCVRGRFRHAWPARAPTLLPPLLFLKLLARRPLEGFIGSMGRYCAFLARFAARHTAQHDKASD